MPREKFLYRGDKKNCSGGREACCPVTYLSLSNMFLNIRRSGVIGLSLILSRFTPRVSMENTQFCARSRKDPSIREFNRSVVPPYSAVTCVTCRVSLYITLTTEMQR